MGWGVGGGRGERDKGRDSLEREFSGMYVIVKDVLVMT